MKLVDCYPYRISRGGDISFLLLRRSPDVIYPGTWRMVGGKVLPGEPSYRAALRELHEETTFKPECFWCVPTLNQFFDHEHDVLRHIPVFAAEIPFDVSDHPTLNHEHIDFNWCPLTTLPLYALWPEQTRIMTLIAQLLEGPLNPAWLIPAK